jgi:predicted nucleotidyltransferase
LLSLNFLLKAFYNKGYNFSGTPMEGQEIDRIVIATYYDNFFSGGLAETYQSYSASQKSLVDSLNLTAYRLVKYGVPHITFHTLISNIEGSKDYETMNVAQKQLTEFIVETTLVETRNGNLDRRIYRYIQEM